MRGHKGCREGVNEGSGKAFTFVPMFNEGEGSVGFDSENTIGFRGVVGVNGGA
jgi:hypothetical protein